MLHSLHTHCAQKKEARKKPPVSQADFTLPKASNPPRSIRCGSYGKSGAHAHSGQRLRPPAQDKTRRARTAACPPHSGIRERPTKLSRANPRPEKNNPQGRNARKAHAPSLGLKYPRCFSDMGRPTRSITASMSSHTSRFFSAFAYCRRKEGW